MTRGVNNHYGYQSVEIHKKFMAKPLDNLNFNVKDARKMLFCEDNWKSKQLYPDIYSLNQLQRGYIGTSMIYTGLESDF